MTIFEWFKMSDSLLHEVDGLNGLISLVEEDVFSMFPCFFSSLTMPSMNLFSIRLVFAKVQYGLLSGDRDDGDDVSGRGNGEFCVFFSSLMPLECFYGLLWKNFATGRTNRRDVNARLASASMNVDDCLQRSMLRPKTSTSAPFCIILIIVCSPNWNDAVIKLSFVDSKLMWCASENASSAALDIVYFGTTGMNVLCLYLCHSSNY